MATDILCINGSARGDGNTRKMIAAALGNLDDVEIVYLNDLNIAPYDYADQHDDFEMLAIKMVSAKTIVFATPVYWYSMSGQMKVFFDRLTDLTDAHKALGKQLAGKMNYAIIAGGTLPNGFTMPIAETVRYFNMHWGGYWFEECGKEGLTQNQLDNGSRFAQKITRSLLEMN